MAKPQAVTGIVAPSVYWTYTGETADIIWGTSQGARTYRLDASFDGKPYKVIYEGKATSYSADLSKEDFAKAVFRVYGVNDDGVSDFTESTEMLAIDWAVREDGDSLYLEPFELIINSNASNFDDVPSVRETTETITGLDGEIPVDMKYAPRIFELVTFMKDAFEDNGEREEFIRKCAAHINRSVRKLRHFLYNNRLFRVKRTESQFYRFPARCNFDISLKAYDVFGYAPNENIIYGDGLCQNKGDEVCKPVFILKGELNNPVITVNDVEYQIAIDTEENDTVYIDSGKESVIIERDGVQSYAAGAFYKDYPVFNVGNNTVSGCYAVKWRDKYFTV